MDIQSLRPRWVGPCAALTVAALALAGCGSSDESTAVDARHPCRGMAPLEAALHYKAEAREAGASKRFVALVTEPTPKVESSPGYARVVAAFYASTLPPAQRAKAAASCAKELAAD